jgi:hypothetical protein
MIRRTLQIFLAAALLAAPLSSQTPVENRSAGARTLSSDASALPFSPSEELVYEGEFTRALLRGVTIAELRFTFAGAGEKSTSTSDANQALLPLRFKAEVVSKGILQKLLGVHFRESIDSSAEPATLAALQTVKLDEQGSRVRESLAVFDRAAGQVTWTERDPKNPQRGPRVVASKMSGAVYDIASAIYFLRTRALTPGSSFEIAVSDSGKVYNVPVRVLGKKRIKTVLGEVETVRVDPEVFGENGLIKGRGHLSVWLTNDERRIPVRAHIKTEMGTLEVKLKSAALAVAKKG